MSNRSKPRSGTSRAAPYASEYELKRDMGTYQYNQDPQFRQHVRERLAVSDLEGTNQKRN